MSQVLTLDDAVQSLGTASDGGWEIYGMPPCDRDKPLALGIRTSNSATWQQLRYDVLEADDDVHILLA